MSQRSQTRDFLYDRYCREDLIRQACEVLQRDDQTEEEFLGAQGVLMLCGSL